MIRRRSGKFTSGSFTSSSSSTPTFGRVKRAWPRRSSCRCQSVWEIRGEFETWSQICVESFLRRAATDRSG